MRFRWRIAAAVAGLGLAAAAGCGTPPAPDGAAWSFDDARFTVTVKRDGNSDIYVVPTDGTAALRLTDHAAPDNFARVSPDGRTLLFQSRRDAEKSDIYVRPLEGGAPVNLTAEAGHDVLPAWSPDGTLLAFMSTRGFEPTAEHPFRGHLHVLRPDGGGLRRVTREPLDSSLGPQDWTRDGRGLLLSRAVDGQLDIFVLDVATGSETRLTDDPSDEYGGAVSPEGTRVAFHAESGDTAQLALVNIDGSKRRLLTAGPGRRYSPRWSPDGNWLLYTAEGDGGQYDIRALRLADGHDVPLLATSDDEREADWLPAWSPTTSPL